MTDISTLVERWREEAVHVAPLGSKSGDARWNAAQSLREAATALTALHAENEVLWAALEEQRFQYLWRGDGMNTEQARIHARAWVVEGRAARAALKETTDG